jgi:hypothetical protein
MNCTYIYLVCGLSIVVTNVLELGAQSAGPLSLPEQIAQARLLRDAAYAKAPVKDKIAAYFGNKQSKKDRVRQLVELTDAEWQLRKKLLQQQKKNRLQLFINKHDQELRMALIAIGLIGATGFVGKEIRAKTKKNQEARDKRKTEKQKASTLTGPAEGTAGGILLLTSGEPSAGSTAA